MSPLTRDRARDLVDRFEGGAVLIAGDVMLDEFLIGRVERLSPEAPVPVVIHDRNESRIGGAANVALNVRALGGKAQMVGVVGADAAGRQVASDLADRGISAASLVVDASRPTTRKLRVVTTRHQQVARIDYEDDREIAPEVEDAIIAAFSNAVRSAAVLLISDYVKGVITRRVMQAVIQAGREAGIPVLVDPKIPHLDYYGGATLITPNHHEAETATHSRIRTTDEARIAARRFRDRAGCASVLITRGEHGMWLLDGSSADPREFELPAVAREVSDVTGAGDTVIATIALALTAGASLFEAATLANHAAGIVVGRFGPATVSADELVATFTENT